MSYIQPAPMDVDGGDKATDAAPPAANGSASPPTENGAPSAAPVTAAAEAKGDEAPKKKAYTKARRVSILRSAIFFFFQSRPFRVFDELGSKGRQIELWRKKTQGIAVLRVNCPAVLVASAGVGLGWWGRWLWLVKVLILRAQLLPDSIAADKDFENHAELRCLRSCAYITTRLSFVQG